MKAITNEILSAWARLDEGVPAALPFDREIYSLGSLSAGAAAFADFCTLELQASLRDTPTILLSVPPDRSEDARRVIGEMLNYLLARSIQEMLNGSQEQKT
jgi:hypothetical protein